MSASLTRSARIRAAVEGISALQVLVLIGTILLVLFGVLLGGRNYVSAVDTDKLVSQPANVVAASGTAELREPTTRSRQA